MALVKYDSGFDGEGDRFIEFVARIGCYKDQPQLDEEGKPLLRRTTSVHYQSEDGNQRTVENLFKIYNRFDVNYIDDDEFTHFHVACEFGCVDVVEKFLELGQDPNCLAQTEVAPPLYWSLSSNRKEMIPLLLSRGADPNLPRPCDGSSALHAICKRKVDDDMIEIFFKAIDDTQQTVQIDARDNDNRTPLQLAASNYLPHAIDVLLDRGADLSSFVFPTEKTTGGFTASFSHECNFELRIASGTLAIFEHLEKRGYELVRSDVLQISKLFAERGLFEKSVDWKMEEERRQLLSQFYPLVKDGTDQLPNLQDSFRPEQIECLLSDCVRHLIEYQFSYEEKRNAEEFVKFVARIGYRVRPSSHRTTTPIHLATRRWFADWEDIVCELFKIYDSCVNYVDEFGSTHFQVACMAGCSYAVERYLDSGLNPNCLVSETGDSLLHLALFYDRNEVVEVLLRNGADPNLANNQGLTPLHAMCIKDYDYGLAKLFFEINDDIRQTVEIDSKDKLGRTPLQLAVQKLLPDVVDLLLARGADLARFVFPADSYLHDVNPGPEYCDDYSLALASNALIVIDRLEDRDYELNRSDALSIMAFFAKLKLFENSTDLGECWNDNEEFTSRAKTIMIKDDAGLSLYDLMKLRPEEAAKSFKFRDYLELAQSYKLSMEFPEKSIFRLVL
ncbi:unnamed protein product [Trichogramma brassicae]|uniref:Uncharacterized protein n=1 Tax=Trichogramma brassicae TaxID=86971 RepID=A0A6H5IB09_9HYME|nr:unnamed protein product [Trichogramma brassicae]